MPEIERTSPNSARAVAEYPYTEERLLEALRAAVARLPRWSLEEASGEDLHAVRTTRVLRFEDDAAAHVSASGEGSRLEVESASKVGKGDLGQNPRNLQELFDAVEEELRRPAE